jgi:hypothetical protein
MRSLSLDVSDKRLEGDGSDGLGPVADLPDEPLRLGQRGMESATRGSFQAVSDLRDRDARWMTDQDMDVVGGVSGIQEPAVERAHPRSSANDHTSSNDAAVAISPPEGRACPNPRAPGFIPGDRDPLADSRNRRLIAGHFLRAARSRATARAELRLVVGKEVAQGAKVYAVSKIVVAPETNGCSPDVALVQLAQVIPESVARPARPAVDAAFRARAHFIPKVTAIGFGVDEQGEAGVRRIRRGIDVLCVPGDSGFDCGADVESMMQPFEMIAGVGACQGDSGGGLYEPEGVEAGDARVVSVVSRGPVEQDGTCLEGIYVRVDAFHELITATARTAAAEGGYPVPSWAGGPATPAPTPSPAAPVDEPPLAPTPTVAPTPPATTTTSGGCSVAAERHDAPGLGGLALASVALLAASRRARRRAI